jgi:hypothetical protein
MDLNALLSALESQGFATAIREGSSLFPWIECLHVLAVAIVVGTISIVDMRLIGLPAHVASVQRLIRDILPFTWGAFALALVTGLLMFASNATVYGKNLPFLIKMGLLVLAGLNMGLFHVVTAKTMHLWDEMVATPVIAKITGGASLTLWVSIIVCGRWIGFV